MMHFRRYLIQKTITNILYFLAEHPSIEMMPGKMTPHFLAQKIKYFILLIMKYAQEYLRILAQKIQACLIIVGSKLNYSGSASDFQSNFIQKMPFYSLKLLFK